MKRKVIQIANSTQLVSLPRQWAQKYGIQKGDELNIEEDGSKIIVSTENDVPYKDIDVDVTGLDKSSIMHTIRGLYRRGYDNIKITFNKPLSIDYRTGETPSVLSIIHEEVNRLAAVEIIQQKENFCIIKEISETGTKEFDAIMRRMFILLTDASRDLANAICTNNTVLLQTIEDKHDSIAKFAGYCLRLLNKKGYTDTKKSLIMYNIIASIDEIADVLKYTSWRALTNKKKMPKESTSIIQDIDKSLQMYYDLFYKFEIKKMHDLSENREKIKRQISQLAKKAPHEDILTLETLAHALEIILHITGARLSLEY